MPAPPPGPSPTPIAGPVAPGTVIEGKYRIDRELGRGGMGVVYEATHLLLERKVAIKMLSSALAGRPDLANRMIREARVISTIGHPNIVAVTDLGLVDGSPFIVMELLVGVSLEQELAQRGTMSLADAIRVVCDVLDALDAAHRRGVVHRDVKPANVMLVRDGAGKRSTKVLDFGIAKIVDGDGGQGATKTAFVLGTPLGMAPEQALGEDVDARADLHAAGSLLYTLLVGTPPFAAPTASVAVARLLEGRFTPASERVPSLPPAVDALLARALARRREDRFSDAAAMRAALVACLPAGKVGPRRATPVLGGAASPGRGGPAEPGDRGSSPAVDGRFGPPPVERLDVGTLLDRPPVRVPEVPRTPASRWLVPVIVGVTLPVAAFALWRAQASDPGTAAPPEVGDGQPEHTAVADDRVLLMVSTTPRGATVFIDDVPVEINPVELPRSETPVRVRVEAQGYVTAHIEVQPTRSQRVEIDLDRRR